MVIESYMLWVWLAVFIIMLIVEAVTQDLVSIWLALGAFISLIFLLCLISPVQTTPGTASSSSLRPSRGSPGS